MIWLTCMTELLYWTFGMPQKHTVVLPPQLNFELVLTAVGVLCETHAVAWLQRNAAPLICSKTGSRISAKLVMAADRINSAGINPSEAAVWDYLNPLSPLLPKWMKQGHENDNTVGVLWVLCIVTEATCQGEPKEEAHGGLRPGGWSWVENCSCGAQPGQEPVCVELPASLHPGRLAWDRNRWWFSLVANSDGPPP